MPLRNKAQLRAMKTVSRPADTFPDSRSCAATRFQQPSWLQGEGCALLEGIFPLSPIASVQTRGPKVRVVCGGRIGSSFFSRASMIVSRTPHRTAAQKPENTTVISRSGGTIFRKLDAD